MFASDAFHVSLETVASCQRTQRHCERQTHFGITIGLSSVTGLHADGTSHDGDLRLAFHATVGVQVIWHESPRTDPESSIQHIFSIFPDEFPWDILIGVGICGICHQPHEFKRLPVSHHGGGDFVDIRLFQRHVERARQGGDVIAVVLTDGDANWITFRNDGAIQCGTCDQDWLSVQHFGSLAIDEAREGAGEFGIGLAIGTVDVIGTALQWRLGDFQTSSGLATVIRIHHGGSH